MNGCVYKTASGQCQKYSDKHRNTLAWCCGDNIICKDRKLSNADKIRAMSDEELKDFLMKVYADGIMIGCGCSDTLDVFDGHKNPGPWLKEEAT